MGPALAPTRSRRGAGVSTLDEEQGMKAETASDLREKIALSCRILAQHGLVKGSTGHVSVRNPGTDDILMRGRPSVDKGLRFAGPSCVIEVDPNGKVVGNTGGVRRVNEIYLHTEVYKRQ